MHREVRCHRCYGDRHRNHGKGSCENGMGQVAQELRLKVLEHRCV